MRFRNPLSTVFLSSLAAAAQAVATIGSFAFLSRVLPLEQVGRFGLYLAVGSFVAGIDGIRQAIVVAVVENGGRTDHKVRQMAALSLAAGVAISCLLAIAAPTLLQLNWNEVLPLCLGAAFAFACSPGLAVLEATRGPQYATSLQAFAWALAIVTGTYWAHRAQDVAVAAWAMLIAPTLITIGLAYSAALVGPSLGADGRTRRIALHGMRLNATTALAGFIDKGAVAAFGGPAAVGLYAPLAEIAGRASGLAGGILNLFLRDEAKLASSPATMSPRPAPHHSIVAVMILAAYAALVLASLAAERIVTALMGASDPASILTARLLLACVALNVGAHWSVVALKARGRFDLYRPYGFTLTAGLLCCPWLVSSYGIVGAGVVAILVRTADAVIVLQARQLAGREYELAVGTTTTLILLVAILGATGEDLLSHLHLAPQGRQ